MKNSLILATLALVATSAPALASANSTFSRGYVLTNHGLTFYAGLTDDNNDVQIQVGSFSEAQQDVMYDCIKKKDQYAVLVETTEKTEKVPTEIPGRSTSFHTTVVVDVSCVRAPGFINYWRQQFHAGPTN